jgi:hypothetical protein
LTEGHIDLQRREGKERKGDRDEEERGGRGSIKEERK